MANILLRSCNELTEVVVANENFLQLNLAFNLNFTGETPLGCYTVITETTDPITDGIDAYTQYNDCLDCLQQNNYSFFVQNCDDPNLSGPVNSNQFNEWPVGNTYQLCGPFFDGCLCFSALSATTIVIEPVFTVRGPFSDCFCENSPRSANTEYNICEVCSGETITIQPPHPVYTDKFGTSVTQLNMITLGGENGLNN
jgi:hypothetical protein